MPWIVLDAFTIPWTMAALKLVDDSALRLFTERNKSYDPEEREWFNLHRYFWNSVLRRLCKKPRMVFLW